MRSPLYVTTAARIYRNAIDSYFAGKFNVEKKDINDLKIAFNREFTTGFCFENKTIVDSRQPMNRGLFLGVMKDGKIKLKTDLKLCDGIGIWQNDEVSGGIVKTIIKNKKQVKEAFCGDIVQIKADEGSRIYKTSSAETKTNLGDEIKEVKFEAKKKEIILPEIKNKENKDKPKIFVKCYNKKSAIEADKAGADIIYYDIMKEDCSEVKKLVKKSKFFVYTPRIQSDAEIEETINKIEQIKPDGILVGNRGLLYELRKRNIKEYELHLDYSFNCFNDIDLECYNAPPIISPELNFSELCEMKNKNFIVLVHGDIVLMTTKEQIKSPELIDEEGRHFKVRHYEKYTEILNSKQLGLFNKTKDYLNHGINYFCIDLQKEPAKFVKIYRKIINNEQFDDTKIKKGYTTGHFERGVN